MRRSRSFPLRFASMLLLVIATQLAFAGDLCRSVMIGNMAAGGTQHASGPMGDSARVEMAMLPCCDRTMVGTSRCLAAPIDAAVTTPAPSVFSQESVGHIVAPVAAPFLRLQSRADPGRSPPPYLLFHRLLS